MLTKFKSNMNLRKETVLNSLNLMWRCWIDENSFYSLKTTTGVIYCDLLQLYVTFSNWRHWKRKDIAMFQDDEALPWYGRNVHKALKNKLPGHYIWRNCSANLYFAFYYFIFKKTNSFFDYLYIILSNFKYWITMSLKSFRAVFNTTIPNLTLIFLSYVCIFH